MKRFGTRGCRYCDFVNEVREAVGLGAALMVAPSWTYFKTKHLCEECIKSKVAEEERIRTNTCSCWERTVHPPAKKWEK